MKFVDRISNNPGRVKIKKESGEEYYAIIERADDPIEEGTPLNAQTLNSMVDKSGDTMTGALNVPELGVQDANGVEKGQLSCSANDYTVTLAASESTSAPSIVQLNAKRTDGYSTTNAKLNWEAGNYQATLYPTGSYPTGTPYMYIGSGTNPWSGGYFGTVYSTMVVPNAAGEARSLTLQAYAKSSPSSTYASGSVALVAQCSCSDTNVFGTTTAQTAKVSWGYNGGDHKWCFYPTGGANGGNRGYYLGMPANKWDAVYATTGTIQTSDRASKDDIRYLVDESAPMVLSLTDDNAETTPASVTVGDVMDFVRNLAPVTFCYKNGEESASEDTARPESIQLGLIADEIEAHPLFRYIGVKSEYEEVVKPEELDEDGNVVAEAVTETRTGFGLQAIPLATVALTACKKMIEELDESNRRLADLERRIKILEEKG